MSPLVRIGGLHSCPECGALGVCSCEPEMTDEEARAALLATFPAPAGDISADPDRRLALQEMSDADYE